MYLKFIDSLFFRPTVLLVAVAMLTMSFMTPERTVVIKPGTVVPLELMTRLTSKNAKSGQVVDFRVVGDIKVDGQTVITNGSVAQGQITRVKKNGLLGSEGELEISIKSAKAVDGTTIYLTGDRLSDEGANRVALSIVVTLLCLFGFLIKGGKAEIPAGYSCQGIVSAEAEITVG
jgi:hypothetical protein